VMWDLVLLLEFLGGTLLGALWMAWLERGEHQQARRYARGMMRPRHDAPLFAGRFRGNKRV